MNTVTGLIIAWALISAEDERRSDHLQEIIKQPHGPEAWEDYQGPVNHDCFYGLKEYTSCSNEIGQEATDKCVGGNVKFCGCLYIEYNECERRIQSFCNYFWPIELWHTEKDKT